MTTQATKEALEPTVDAMWEALKAACCKNPVEAKLAVFVSEKKFKEALAPFTAPIAPVVDDEAMKRNDYNMEAWRELKSTGSRALSIHL